MIHSTRVLLACSLLSSVLGSIHAYSIFIDPLETVLGVDRWAVSSVYSLALVSLTLAVLFGHRLIRIERARPLVVTVGVMAALGLMIAAEARSIPVLVVGYGVIFGSANGVGYAFCLQVSAAANPHRRGFALGIVTAVYALGAAAAALSLDDVVDEHGHPAALRILGLTIAIAAIVAAALLGHGSTESTERDEHHDAIPHPVPGTLVKLWMAYGLAVFAGLMALGHAAAIVESAGGSLQLGARTVAIAGLMNAAGGILIALLADRLRSAIFLVGLPVLSSVALLFLFSSSGGATALVGLAAVALIYGSVIAVYPFVVTQIFGAERYATTYGRVFTAWGLAGLAGPILAGAIFDLTGDYGPALLLAAVAAAASAAVAISLPRVSA
ncbi:MAG: OFA family oxalate/formate antiporter-like MFS transporter [Verrucomicrobiales bacterium]